MAQPQAPVQQQAQQQVQQQAQQPQVEEGFNLPPDVMQQGVRSQSVGSPQVDLTSDDKGLDSWANKYGDIPL